ncbi:MAG: hypothetical protein GEV09_24295 [Pseudonocardiaceae bacterium]|nr:hypothetical protein [Pseudonocardiaceae bacterium]
MEHEIIPLHAPFDVVLRGFDRQQVLDHIESLQGHLDLVESDRDAAVAHADDLRKEVEYLRSEGAALEHLRREAGELAEQRQRLYSSPLAGIGGRIEQMLTLAEQEATETRSRVEQEATELRSRAEQDVAAQREQARAETERLSRDTEQRCERLEAASLQRRRQAEQDSEREIARRHAEADARIADDEQRSLAGLHLMIRTVGEQLACQVSEVRQEVDTLTRVRDEVSEQLSAASWMLTEAIGRVQATRANQLDDLPETVPAQRQTDTDPDSRHHHAAEVA